MASIVEELRSKIAQQDAEIAALKRSPLPGAVATVDALGSQHGRRDWSNPGAPAVRKGEDPMTSRPFRFLNLFGALGGHIKPENCVPELEVCKSFESGIQDFGWRPSANSLSVPLGMSHLPDNLANDAKMQVVKAMLGGGAEQDLDKVKWTRDRAYGPLSQKGFAPAQMKMQSALSEILGGSLIAPPEFGEIIELLRNQEALVNAGARTIQLPAQGSVMFPRITSPTTAGTYAENQPITDSTVGTGHLTLSAKKIASIVQVPNELFRYATAAAEAILRNDMTKTLALQADLYFLEGNGNNNYPKGLIYYNDANGIVQYQNSTAPTPRGIGTNGNTVQPQDGYNMAALVEENNAMIEGWIMRPSMWASIGGFRADAVTAGDAAGAFVQSLFRAMADNLDPAWCGYPITKTNQINRSIQKGTSSNLTYILGGMWSDFLIGLFGAIEFLATNVADTPFKNDLTWIRGIMLGDSGPRHTGAFVIYNFLTRT
jgi:HK97 family phage major capsid protein